MFVESSLRPSVSISLWIRQHPILVQQKLKIREVCYDNVILHHLHLHISTIRYYFAYAFFLLQLFFVYVRLVYIGVTISILIGYKHAANFCWFWTVTSYLQTIVFIHAEVTLYLQTINHYSAKARVISLNT